MVRKPAGAKQTAGAGTPDPGRSNNTKATVDRSETQEAGESRSAGSRHRTAAASRSRSECTRQQTRKPAETQVREANKGTPKTTRKLRRPARAAAPGVGTEQRQPAEEQSRVYPTTNQETSRNPSTGSEQKHARKNPGNSGGRQEPQCRE